MADQPPFPPRPPLPPSTGSTPPPVPVGPSVPLAPRPITPPAGIPVKDTNLSGISPSPAPHLPSSAPQTPPTPQNFKSSVRTMASDMGVPRPAPIAPPPSPRAIPTPVPPRPPSPITPPPLPTRPAVNIPQDNSRSKKGMLLIIFGVLGIAIIIVLFLMFFRDSDDAQSTPTPTVSQTPTTTPTPFGFQEIFSVSTPLSGNLDEAISAQTIGIGEVKTFTTEGTGVAMPTELTNALDQSEPTYISIFGKPDGTKSLGFARKINDAVKASSALAAWESSMAQDLQAFLKINTTRSASTNFLSTMRQGMAIKYRNFPDAFNSVDYAIVELPDGSRYLVITGSRDHMFAIIDRATGVILGK